MDARLRNAERIGTRIEVIVARLRAGTLARERLELAAFLGDRDTRGLLGDTPDRRVEDTVRTFSLPDGPKAWWYSSAAALDQWVLETRRFDFTAPYRAAVAIARANFATYLRPTPSQERYRVVDRVEDWILCPCRSHSLRARSFGLRLPRWVAGLANACGDKAQHVERYVNGDACLECAMHRVVDSITRRLPDSLTADHRLKRAAAEELIPWALGFEDALAARVAGRARG